MYVVLAWRNVRSFLTGSDRKGAVGTRKARGGGENHGADEGGILEELGKGRFVLGVEVVYIVANAGKQAALGAQGRRLYCQLQQPRNMQLTTTILPTRRMSSVLVGWLNWCQPGGLARLSLSRRWSPPRARWSRTLLGGMAASVVRVRSSRDMTSKRADVTSSSILGSGRSARDEGEGANERTRW